ncbi:MAG TPA: helicase-related protein [bacterium]|nr:helicase-related protein [bacterium]
MAPPRKILKSLPLVGFGQTPMELDRRADWENFALKIINHFRSGNVALVAETGAGKTVIALMAIIAKNWRTLFLAPQRYLAGQHQRLLDRISGESVPSQMYTGLTKKRDWNSLADRIIFATPHIALNDYRRQLIDLSQFDLVVIDEFHKAIGDYPYVSLAQVASSKRLKILALSASPGGDLEKIETVRKNCRISHWLKAEIKTPTKNEYLEMVKLDDNLKKIEQLFLSLLRDTALDLTCYGLTVNEKKLPTIKELNRLKECVDSLKGEEVFYPAISAYARYAKLRHAYAITISEGYGSFLAYLEKLRKDQSRAVHDIFQKNDFHEIVALARQNQLNHPKVYQLLQLASNLKERGKTALVFVGLKDTAEMLLDFMERYKIKADIVFGGADKNLSHQEKVLDQLADRQLDCLICTSVMEEGVSIGEVDSVIHYSMPPTEISRLQRSGRTGRLRSGEVIYLAIDHALDTNRYFATKRKLERMKEALRQNSFDPADSETIRYHKRKIDRTLPLI